MVVNSGGGGSSFLLFVVVSVWLMMVVSYGEYGFADRDRIHWTPHNEYMGPIAAYHIETNSTTGRQVSHIFYTKTANKAQFPEGNDITWGHLVTDDNLHFTEVDEPFFDMADDPYGYDGGVLHTSPLLLPFGRPSFVIYGSARLDPPKLFFRGVPTINAADRRALYEYPPRKSTLSQAERNANIYGEMKNSNNGINDADIFNNNIVRMTSVNVPDFLVKRPPQTPPPNHLDNIDDRQAVAGGSNDDDDGGLVPGDIPFPTGASWPYVFTVGTKTIVAYFTAECYIHLALLFYSSSGYGLEMIPFYQWDKTIHEKHKCSGLTVTRLEDDRFLIARGAGDGTESFSHYSTIDIINNGKTFPEVTQPVGWFTLDSGPDGSYFSMRENSNGTLTGYGWASNIYYNTSSLPTPLWKNSMTVMRSFKYNQKSGRLNQNFHLGEPLKTIHLQPTNITSDACDWSVKFGQELASRTPGAYLFNFKFARGTRGYTMKFFNKNNPLEYLQLVKPKESLVAYQLDRSNTISPDTERTYKCSVLPVVGDVRFLLDRTTVELLVEDGECALTSKYYLRQPQFILDELCITTFGGPAILESGSVEKYASIWEDSSHPFSVTLAISTATVASIALLLST